MTTVYAILIAQGLAILLLGLLVAGLLRSHAATLRTLDGLGVRLDGQTPSSSSHVHRDPIGGDAHDVLGISPDGEAVSISASNNTGLLLLAFLSTSCTSCTDFWNALGPEGLVLGDRRYRAVAITLGPDEESPTRARRVAVPGTSVVMSSEAWSHYGVPGAPHFVLVDTDRGRVVGEGSAVSVPQLGDFLRDAEADQAWDAGPAARDHRDRSRIDEELRRAGIVPGDPRLYPGRGEVGEDRG